MALPWADMIVAETLAMIAYTFAACRWTLAAMIAAAPTGVMALRCMQLSIAMADSGYTFAPTVAERRRRLFWRTIQTPDSGDRLHRRNDRFLTIGKTIVKTLTKANLKRHSELRKASDDLQAQIYACGSRSDRLSECKAKAPVALVDSYDAANSALWAWERQMVNEGRGWYDSAYRFYPY